MIPPLKVREAWQTYELELINYQNRCKLIRGWDDLFEKVREHISSVSQMKLSPYYKVNTQTVGYLNVIPYVKLTFFIKLISLNLHPVPKLLC